jgi:hypothetical protein
MLKVTVERGFSEIKSCSPLNKMSLYILKKCRKKDLSFANTKNTQIQQ